jgi:hypothetical protein
MKPEEIKVGKTYSARQREGRCTEPPTRAVKLIFPSTMLDQRLEVEFTEANNPVPRRIFLKSFAIWAGREI